MRGKPLTDRINRHSLAFGACNELFQSFFFVLYIVLFPAASEKPTLGRLTVESQKTTTSRIEPSLFPGNANEQTSLKPLEQKIPGTFGSQMSIICPLKRAYAWGISTSPGTRPFFFRFRQLCFPRRPIITFSYTSPPSHPASHTLPGEPFQRNQTPQSRFPLLPSPPAPRRRQWQPHRHPAHCRTSPCP